MRVVLVGGGHAHVHLLAAAAANPLKDTDLVLVSPTGWHHYSGMVPGYLAGTYTEADMAFDLRALAREAGARLVEGFATSISAARGEIDVEARSPAGAGAGVGARGGASAEVQRISFDRASLDVGSVPVGLELPGVREHAASVRPMSRAVELRERLDALVARDHEGPVRVCVVGAGAGGVEVALALNRRILAGGGGARVTLVEAGEHVLPGFSERVRRRALRVLHRAGVTVLVRTRATRVAPDALALESGESLPSELTVWLGGAAPPPLLGGSDLPLDPEGFFLVDAELRAVARDRAGRPPVWGAGDCIALEGAPWMPRAGVYAVRQSPILARNVLGAPDADAAPARYSPQRSFLALLNSADGRALLRWKGLVSHSRWAWWLKDRIDRRFMARYQR
ncbi:MAG: pyridine nucleotide-disulfide oxidoreductase [Gemmatimonadales bacterium]|nr:MAG: pyridine nucleotide-disulfide oxidoreductase [Gemmatimonadales bacterium]